MIRAFTLEIKETNKAAIWVIDFLRFLGVKILEQTVCIRCGKFHRGRNCKP